MISSPSTMAEVPNRNGDRLRPVLKAKPQKKSRKPMLFSTSKAAMKNIEARLQRNPELPKWDILIQPVVLV